MSQEPPTGTADEPRTEADVLLGDGRAMRVQLLLPAGTPPRGGWPGVVVLHEAYGLTPEVRAVGARFAARGWAAVVPAYFSAGSSTACLVRGIREVVSGRPGPLSRDLDRVRGWLADRAEVDGDRIAVIGFCLGGGLAMLLGAASDGVRAVSANYGWPPRKDALRGCAPVTAAYGGRDLLFARTAAVLDQRLTDAGVEHEVTTYPQAGHSFLTDGHHPLAHVLMFPLRGGYVAEAADEQWEKVFAWFDAHTQRA
jgi:carboxymethylenebutenolidase